MGEYQQMQAPVSGRLRSVAGASGVGECCETAVVDAVTSGSYSHVSEHPTPAVWAGCVGAQVVMVDHGW